MRVLDLEAELGITVPTISVDLLRFIEIFAIAYWVVLQVMLVTVGVLVGSVKSVNLHQHHV